MPEKKLRYRLGIDLGTTSIGTALVALEGPAEHPEPKGIFHMGVRIFEDGRDPKRKPLAVSRRVARQARRRRDRYLRRRQRLINAFVHFGLFPQDETQRKALEALSPYKLRSDALDQQIPLSHFGRALFHLSQRRGFKSSRKSGKSDDDGKIKSGIRKLNEQLESAHCRTVGEYFYKTRILQGLSVRARPVGSGAKAEYPFYLSRGLIEQEFDQLWSAQAHFYPEVCTEATRSKIKDILLYQRPLKPVKPGRCSLETDEDRCPLADPLYQKFRVLQDLNHLRILLRGQPEAALSLDQRNLILGELQKGKETEFDKIKKLLKFSNEARFSLEEAKRDSIKGDETAKILGSKKYFGPRWQKFPLEEQRIIVKKLLTYDDTKPDAIEFTVQYLVQQGLDRETAGNLMEQDLPAGYGRLSIKALQRILPYLEAEVITYYQAVAKAGYVDREPEHKTKLPYYGEILERHIPHGTGNPEDPEELRIGKIANPTVHIALNQLRRVVNCVIKHFGPPEQVVIELARDLKMGEQRKKEEEKKRKGNEAHNKKIDDELEKQGLPRKGENRLRYKLWEELGGNPCDRVCPYSGKPISIQNLFSEEIEIEHILPFAQTYDDSVANKTVAYRFANRAKGNRTPHEAFGTSPNIGGQDYDWEAILTRAWNLPRNKSWRFEPNALEHFKNEGGFTDRQLNDTAYASKMAREYLTAICDKNKVWSVPGRLTSLLRAKWGLNEILGTPQENGTFVKNRDHHGHHAIDALVVALTDRGLLNRLSKHSAEMLAAGHRALSQIPTPWEALHADAQERLGRLVVSHRKDHGLGGALHNDTAYGIVDEKTVQHRVGLEKFDTLKQIKKIKSENIRELLEERYLQSGPSGWKDALQEFQNQTNIRHVRIIETSNVMLPINNDCGKAYKAFVPGAGGNYCYDIWVDSKGKWDGRVISRFEANQNHGQCPPRKGPEGQPLVLRLIVGDTVRLKNLDHRYWHVEKMTDGKIYLAPIHEGGSLKKRDENKADSFKYLVKSPNTLKALSCQLVHVDECGFVFGAR
ncbi:MAG TPA: type II CRISPR RNA-guided endonuclease Cas9 [Fibrobacteraceae bacterium]|nr:type II CRISPR RNA-guided endonuclease Cas9 [Fibrobacteraceae bacterium]